ncbi:hypothetical protein JL722_3487 [Aureococcus anophagefferens]|nr:hypothetical protein JL722_3487 [Aureococcus anophagefferens]
MKRGECDDGSVLDVPHRKYCARRKVVFQNFVEDVSEIFGRKYDVRVWALVTSVDRSRHFTAGMEPEGYPKSTASRAFTERDVRPAGLPGRRVDARGQRGAPGVDDVAARRGLVDQGAAAVAGQAPGRGAEAADLESRTRGGGAPVAARTSPAAMLSPDFVLDRRGVPHLEEINHKGLIIGENGDDQFGIHTGNDGGADIIFTDYGALRSLLQIAGVDDFPEAPAYADKLDAAICAFCGSRDGTPKPASDWPDQFKLTEAHLAAFVESRLDRVVREFLEATDTSLIHGRVVVPGHGRWPPR